MKITNIPLTSIKTAGYNPRLLTKEDKQNILNSLTRFGFVEPLVVNKRTNTLVGGHQRYTIATELDYKEVPVVFVDLDDEQERELNVRLNRNKGEWDINLLSEYFTKDELTTWGFSEQYLLGLWNQIKEDTDSTGEKTKEDTEEVQEEEPVRVVLFYEEEEYKEVMRILNQLPGTPTDKGKQILEVIKDAKYI